MKNTWGKVGQDRILGNTFMDQFVVYFVLKKEMLVLKKEKKSRYKLVYETLLRTLTGERRP